MAHVKPYRWADAHAGRVDRGEVASMQQHAECCVRCAGERDRIGRAIDSFADIRATEAPPVHWDHIGARVYWVTSSERRLAERGARRGDSRIYPRFAFLPPALAAAAAIARWWISAGSSQRGEMAGVEPPAQHSFQPVANQPQPAAPPLDSPPQLRGVVTFLQGPVAVDGATLRFDQLVQSGAHIVTGQGRVTIQFAEGSGFTLQPQSTATLHRFDERAVEVHVVGELIASIARGSGQTFTVVAGKHRVQVLGTIFQVRHREDRLEVACSRGRVAITGDSEQINIVKAGEVARMIGRGISRDTLDVGEIGAMDRAVPQMPTWTGAEDLRNASSRLDIAPSAKQPVAVTIDGITIGQAPFVLRVTPGRHHVKAEGSSASGVSTGSWIEVEAGSSVRPVLTDSSIKTSLARPSRTNKMSRRQRQIRRILDKSPWFDVCMWPLRKQGIAEGAFISLDIGIGKRGEIRHLNVLDSNLPGAGEQCIREAVDRFEFGPGPAATTRYRISL